jgi:bifunctional DNA-binding transcriptional regulator/antitoxin component of YhaV-PrlF toxin-antitoxin module
MKTATRRLSQNGQVAIPRAFLKSLGVTPPAKVEVTQERDAVVIRKSSMGRLSDEDFSALLMRIRIRNRGLKPQQVAESIRLTRQARHKAGGQAR